MPSDLLFELGSEELPASFIAPALEELSKMVLEGLAAARLEVTGEVRTFGTPRRLALWVRGIADVAPDAQKEVTGPSVRAGFSPDGKPTQAAEKFAQSLSLSVDALKRVQTPKGEYLGAVVLEKGKRALDVLPTLLHGAAHGLHFKKSMRWGDTDLSYARPLHWIVELFGAEVVPVIFADVKSGRTTFGHRFLAPEAIVLEGPASYESALEKAHVIADVKKRKSLLVERVQAAARAVNAQVLPDDALVDQVTGLVELPSPVVGTFDARHLDLPPEVLVQEMKSHQRYFSLTDAAGKLLPKFIAVSNTPVRDEALSLKGYERVLRARLSDGRFFFDEDRREKLETRLPKLARVVWQGQLGSYADKVARLGVLVKVLADSTGKAALQPTLDRAAALCKADLVTGMVGEFPELQGVMGREYALASGEDAAVAQAIFEHYLPRSANDALPSGDAGALLGLADRLDSLAGIFGIGKSPTGAADPFALRRACIAVINVTLARGYRFSLSKVLDAAFAGVEPKLKDVKRKAGEASAKDQLVEFFRGRMKSAWSEHHRADAVDAVLGLGIDDVVRSSLRLAAVSKAMEAPTFPALAATFKRVANLVEKQAKDVTRSGPVESLLKENADKALFSAWAAAKVRVTEECSRDDYGAALTTVSGLKGPVDTFFDEVMVMAEDKALKENRVRLLMAVSDLFGQVADFSKLQVEAT